MLRVEPEIIRDYVDPGVVRLAFHHVLDHGDASQLAHRTVECAGAQEPLAFWRMHNLLFERQDALWQADAATVTAFATELGLGAEAFAACLDDAAIVEKVERMDQARRDSGIRLRPTFEINERRIEGGVPFSLFQQVFQETGLVE